MLKKTQLAALLLLAAGLLLLGSCGGSGRGDIENEAEAVSPSQVMVTRSASPKFYAGHGN